MQVFKLVKPGFVDKLIAFDELPEDVMRGVRRGPVAGWPRHWKEFLGVKPTDNISLPFFVLDYITVNADKEKWQEISSFVKRNVAPNVRLLDKLEAMAIPAAPDSYSDVTLEPEDLAVIKIEKSAAPTEDAAPRRGRKPKVDEVLAA